MIHSCKSFGISDKGKTPPGCYGASAVEALVLGPGRGRRRRGRERGAPSPLRRGCAAGRGGRCRGARVAAGAKVVFPTKRFGGTVGGNRATGGTGPPVWRHGGTAAQLGGTCARGGRAAARSGGTAAQLAGNCATGGTAARSGGTAAQPGGTYWHSD
eukprot:gene12393-biopygen12887